MPRSYISTALVIIFASFFTAASCVVNPCVLYARYKEREVGEFNRIVFPREAHLGRRPQIISRPQLKPTNLALRPALRQVKASSKSSTASPIHSIDPQTQLQLNTQLFGSTQRALDPGSRLRFLTALGPEFKIEWNQPQMPKDPAKRRKCEEATKKALKRENTWRHWVSALKLGVIQNCFHTSRDQTLHLTIKATTLGGSQEVLHVDENGRAYDKRPKKGSAEIGRWCFDKLSSLSESKEPWPYPICDELLARK